MKEEEIYIISKNTKLGKIMKNISAIIIDEAPSLNKNVYEAIDRSLKDVRESTEYMGGVPTLFCGDFR